MQVNSIQLRDRPDQVLPFLARVDLGAMAMNGCSAFPKAPASLEPHHQDTRCGVGLTHLQSVLKR